ncbi:prephenate dehydrogenase/arogenate dehydrogenase family protein [Salinarchaeum chitinilyticum]
MELLVVGAGTMGRWIARTVDAEVAFADRDPEAAAAAAEAIGGRTVALDGAETFDVVCLAVPMSAVEGTIAQQAGRARHAIVDVAGEMERPLAAMAEHGPDLERASLHPLFAPENAPGTIAVVVDAAGPSIDALLADLEVAGNELVATTPEEHDRAMESVQAAAHAAIVAYGLARESVPEGFATPVSAALDDLLEQVTSGDPGVYAEIQDRFDGAAEVADAATAIEDADPAELRELFAAARIEEPTPSETGPTPTTEDDA